MMLTILKVGLLVVEVLVSLLLIGVVLLQRSREQGLGLAVAADVGESLFGSKAANVLVRITVVLAVIFVLNTMWLAYLYAGAQGSASGSIMGDVNKSGPRRLPRQQPSEMPSQPQSELPPSTAPAGGGSGPAAPTDFTLPAAPLPPPAASDSAGAGSAEPTTAPVLPTR